MKMISNKIHHKLVWSVPGAGIIFVTDVTLQKFKPHFYKQNICLKLWGCRVSCICINSLHYSINQDSCSTQNGTFMCLLLMQEMQRILAAHQKHFNWRQAAIRMHYTSGMHGELRWYGENYINHKNTLSFFHVLFLMTKCKYIKCICNVYM